MLSIFDWLRRCHSGAELLATLRYFAAKPNVVSEDQEIGAPLSALDGPCRRCYIFSRAGRNDPYCKRCKAILDRTGKLTPVARKSAVIWCHVNHLPRRLQEGKGFDSESIVGSYIHETNRFLLMIRRRELKSWLQDLVLHHGADLKGLIQIFPTLGYGGETGIGEILCWAIYHDSSLPMDQLRVQFYSSPFQVMKPRVRDRQGLLTFEVAEFLSLLEMAEVFRALLRPGEQKQLHELLNLDDPKEEQFYWGRFLGQLQQEAKDMLSAWRIRQWPKNRIKLLYELIEYAVFPHSN